MNRILAAASMALMLGTSSLAHAAMANLTPYSMDAAVDMRASDLIGQRVYATETDVEGLSLTKTEVGEYDDIGEVNDVILSPTGEVKAVVLGIGGFLGLGEKDVTVELSSLRFVADKDDAGDRFIVVNANKDQLTALAQTERETAVSNMETAPADTAVVTTDPAAEPVATAETDSTTTVVPVENAEANAQPAMETKPETAEAIDKENGEQAPVKMETAEAPQTDATVTTTETAQAPVAETTTTETTQAPVAETTTTETAVVAVPVEREMLVRPNVEREGYAMVADNEMTTEDLTGKRVYGINDEDIGEVSNLVMAEDGQSIKEAVLDVGGFLGIGEREVAVPLSELQMLKNADGDVRVYIQATQEQLEQQPEYKAAN